jgi:hypothetical protein
MCRPIGAAASPLPKTCERSNFHSENDASVEALAFSLYGRTTNMAKKPDFSRWFMRMAHSAPIGACRPDCVPYRFPLSILYEETKVGDDMLALRLEDEIHRRRH